MGRRSAQREMERDHWILSNIDLNILFESQPNDKWNEAYKNSFIKI